ncbi:MAG: hypothetical protein QM820_02550 [Minicystis sp.]
MITTFALVGCGRGGGADGHAASSASTPPSASAPAPPGSATVPASVSATVSARPSAVPDEPPAGTAPPASFTGAKAEKACHAQTVEVATYQTRGEIALAGQGDAVAAAWRVRLAGKRQEQIAFASFDKEGHPLARPRGVGDTTHDVPPRLLGTGSAFAVIWFDDKGLAFARARTDPLPPPEIAHVGSVGPDVAADVAIALWPAGGGIAAAPFGDGSQLGLFVFAPDDGSAVKAMGVTHHAKKPHRPAIAASAAGTFVAWDDGGALMASRFDAAGKEGASACTIAPATATPRERFALVPTAGGAVAMWMEGPKVRTRALDASACPASPIWTVGEGKWATMAALGDTPLVAWVDGGGRLLSVRLAASGAPAARGIDASEGTSGVKDPPAVVTFGGRAAFGWAEVMSPAISTKRLNVRIVDATCVP